MEVIYNDDEYYNINKINKQILKLMFSSCCCNDIEMTQMLINRISSLDINSYDNSGRNMLGIACEKGHIGIVNILLSNPGIDVNLPGDNCKFDFGHGTGMNTTSWTPLVIAINNGHTEIAKRLLQHPNINVVTGFTNIKTTAFTNACEQLDYNIIHDMLDMYELDINYCKSQAITTFLSSVIHYDDKIILDPDDTRVINVVEHFIDRDDFEFNVEYNFHMISTLFVNQHIVIATMLLTHCVNKHYFNISHTQLNNLFNTIEGIINNNQIKLDLNMFLPCFNNRDIYGDTFVQKYSYMNTTLLNNIVDLSNSDSLNNQNDNGQTLLHKFLEPNTLQRILAKVGIDVNVQDCNGNTPLHLLVQAIDYVIDSESSEIAQLLHTWTVHHDAVSLINNVKLLLTVDTINCNLKNNKGKTILDLALNNFNTTLVELLLHRDDINIAGLKNCKGENILKHLLCVSQYNNIRNIQNGIVDNNGDNNGDNNIVRFTTLIHSRISHLIDLIIARKDFDINERDEKNEMCSTMLHFACLYENSQMVKKLLTRTDIDVNVCDRNGFTPLMYTSPVCNLDVLIMLLIDRRTDVNVRNIEGRTVLDMTCSNCICIDDTDPEIRCDAIKCILAAGGTTYYDLNDPVALANTPVDYGTVTQDQVCIDDYALVLSCEQNPSLLTKYHLQLEHVEWLFTMIVLLCDRYYTLKPCVQVQTQIQNNVRFFNICCKLPMELQMIICYRRYGSNKNNVPGFAVTKQTRLLLL